MVSSLEPDLRLEPDPLEPDPPPPQGGSRRMFMLSTPAGFRHEDRLVRGQTRRPRPQLGERIDPDWFR